MCALLMSINLMLKIKLFSHRLIEKLEKTSFLLIWKMKSIYYTKGEVKEKAKMKWKAKYSCLYLNS